LSASQIEGTVRLESGSPGAEHTITCPFTRQVISREHPARDGTVQAQALTWITPCSGVWTGRSISRLHHWNISIIAENECDFHDPEIPPALPQAGLKGQRGRGLRFSAGCRFYLPVIL